MKNKLTSTALGLFVLMMINIIICCIIAYVLFLLVPNVNFWESLTIVAGFFFLVNLVKSYLFLRSLLMKDKKLNRREELLLSKLLDKFKLPVQYDTFVSLMRNFISNPVELLVLNQDNEILLIERNDKEYGRLLHSPGTVYRPGEKVADALNRLLATELKDFPINKQEIVKLNWTETQKGCKAEDGRTSDRQEIHLNYACVVNSTNLKLDDNMKFYSMDDLPFGKLVPQQIDLIPAMFKMYHSGKYSYYF